MAAKLKLLNHNSFSITITIGIDRYYFDRCLKVDRENHSSVHSSLIL